MKLTPRQVAQGLKGADKTLSEVVRHFRNVGQECNAILSERSRVSEKITEARAELAIALQQRAKLNEIDANVAEIRKWTGHWDKLTTQYESKFESVIDERMEPIAAAVNSAIVLAPVLEILRAEWLNLPDQVAARIHNKIGGMIAL